MKTVPCAHSQLPRVSDDMVTSKGFRT
uniref:Uncharacterized protein n=1 Tax=Rhizophora mucronata TaxID=61149 RepID=A0A2P2NTM1_RHIMU